MKRNKGFTLAEMLIVVAIIGILVAIVTPVLTKNLEKAREATDLSNIRSAISKLQNAVINEETVSSYSYYMKTHTQIYKSKYDDEKAVGMNTILLDTASKKYKMFVLSEQKQSGWQGGTDSVAGYTLPSTDNTFKMFKIMIDPNTQEITIEVTAFGGTKL